MVWGTFDQIHLCICVVCHVVSGEPPLGSDVLKQLSVYALKVFPSTISSPPATLSSFKSGLQTAFYWHVCTIRSCIKAYAFIFFMFEGIESGQRQLVHMFRARQRDKGVSLTWALGLCIFMFLKARCFVFSLSFNARFNRSLPMNVFSLYTFFLCLFASFHPTNRILAGFQCCHKTHFLFVQKLCVGGFGCYLW